MGLWSKVKGVFGRIGSGIKQGYNWVKEHLNDIKDVADKAKVFVPEQYRDAYDKYSDQGFNKVSGIINKIG